MHGDVVGSGTLLAEGGRAHHQGLRGRGRVQVDESLCLELSVGEELLVNAHICAIEHLR